MENYQIIFSVISAVILFLYGLSSFSAELKVAAGEKLEAIMKKLTTNRFVAFLVGLISTTLIQSSTAVSSIAVSMVDSGILSFAGSLAIMLGAYVGTTATAWLVSFKLTGIGPIFIVLGTLISVTPSRIKVFGKGVFFFGFIFFSLDLVSTSIAPLRESQILTDLLLHTSNRFVSILMGIALTVILQSSTVVTGLTIIFVQQGLLQPADSIPIVLGANIGTTFTALFVSFGMGLTAKKFAASNTLINTIGVISFIPFLDAFTEWTLSVSPNETMVVAMAHLGFNVVLVTMFLMFLNPFIKFIDWIFENKYSGSQTI